MAAGLISWHAAAQSNDGVRTRALFTKKQADGMEIKVLKNVGGAFTLVDPGQEFKAGDEIRVQFKSNFNGYVYFVNVTPGGASRVIYNSEIKADQMNELPASPNVIAFDDKEKGVEVLKVVTARKPVQVFEEAIKKSKGELGKSAASVATELVSNNPKPSDKTHPENVGILQPANKSGERCRGLELALGKEVRCRGLELAPGSDKKGEGAVMVAMPDGKNKSQAGGELKPGEVAVIEIRLKHI